MRKPDAIITGDIHLREDVPTCRTDDFLAEQWRKLEWLAGLQAKYNCPVLDSGDLFNRWKPSLWLLVRVLVRLPQKFITVPGNHDLPGHNLSMLEKSGLAVLMAAGAVRVDKSAFSLPFGVIHPFPWGTDLLPSPPKTKGRNVALWHVMTYQGEPPWPGCEDSPAKTLLKKARGFDLVITGHNHKPFVVEYQGRLLVNPGSLMRTTTDQIRHRPRVYLWYADTNEVKPVFIPIKRGVISREHLDKKEERDQRMEAFIDRLNQEYDAQDSFEKSLESFFQSNKIRKSVQQIIMEAVHGTE